jgi:hypothetical protein
VRGSGLFSWPRASAAPARGSARVDLRRVPFLKSLPSSAEATPKNQSTHCETLPSHEVLPARLRRGTRRTRPDRTRSDPGPIPRSAPRTIVRRAARGVRSDLHAWKVPCRCSCDYRFAPRVTSSFFIARNKKGGSFDPPLVDHEHPLVDPHVSHLRHVPFLTIVKLLHSEQATPS